MKQFARAEPFDPDETPTNRYFADIVETVWKDTNRLTKLERSRRLVLVGLLAVAAAVALHAALPRYEWTHIPESPYWLRTDRWTGAGVAGRFDATGTWRPGQ